MVQKIVGVALAFGLLTICALAQSAEQLVGTVQGLVFTIAQEGGRLVVPSAKISLDGPSHLEAESNNEGNFTFNAVPSGSYTVTAHAPGLSATLTTVVSAGAVSELTLEMKLQAVVESATVTASTDQVDTKEASGSTTIDESAVREEMSWSRSVFAISLSTPRSGITQGQTTATTSTR